MFKYFCGQRLVGWLVQTRGWNDGNDGNDGKPAEKARLAQWPLWVAGRGVSEPEQVLWWWWRRWWLVMSEQQRMRRRRLQDTGQRVQRGEKSGEKKGLEGEGDAFLSFFPSFFLSLCFARASNYRGGGCCQRLILNHPPSKLGVRDKHKSTDTLIDPTGGGRSGTE